ncbi:MAG: hypothetical protein AAGA96_02160 [Verrucomicrobiota bacterium]
MNSLTLGFLYVCGFSWILCETCVSASNGNWIPLILFVIGFTLMFALLGCIPLSEKAVNITGPVFSILIGGSIAAYGLLAFVDGSLIGGLLRFAGAAMMVGLGAMGLFLTIKEESAH